MLVQLADAHFGYPGTEIFTGLTWQVNPGDRIGLVGPNGCGKSTLLRLLAGELEPDHGQVARARGLRIGYLKQSQEFEGQGKIFEALLKPFARVLLLRAELAELERALARKPELVQRYGAVQEQYHRLDGYTLESRVKALAYDLGFHQADLERAVSTLSGGERGRLELAKALLEQPDLLLLDEPTNHLDVEATEHLEERLAEWPTAFVLVSHDRYFLRAVCREIVEVEGRQVVRFPGGYDRYLSERAVRLERMGAAYERQREQIAKTEEFIRKNIAGQKTKQAKSRRKMLEKLERLGRPADEMRAAGQIGLRFSRGEHAGGKEVIKAEGVELGFGEGPPLVTGFSLTIYRGERVGLVGPNGSGKSTLLKALLGLEPPRRGTVTLGHGVRVGYFDQKLSGLDEEHSLIDEIRQVRGDLNEDVARQYLGRFRFSGDDGFRKVRGLSGGERNRLALAKLMLRPRNLLALDEPTNHLDIPAREVLEEALADYDGTVVVISHDRYFLDRIVQRIVHLHGGMFDVHVGNYTDFKQRLTVRAAGGSTASPPPNAGPPPPSKLAEPQPREPNQRVREREQRKQAQRELERKQRRLAQLEDQIAATEKELALADQALAGDHGGDWQKLHVLIAEKEQLESRLRSLFGEWEKLGAELVR